MKLLGLFFIVLFSGCLDSSTRGGNPLLPIRLSFESNPQNPLPEILELSACFESITYIPRESAVRFTALLWPGGSLFTINKTEKTPLYDGNFALELGTFDAIGFQYGNNCGFAAKVVNEHGTFVIDELNGRSLVFNYYNNPITISDNAFQLDLEVSELLQNLVSASSKEAVIEILTLIGGYPQP